MVTSEGGRSKHKICSPNTLGLSGAVSFLDFELDFVQSVFPFALLFGCY